MISIWILRSANLELGKCRLSWNGDQTQQNFNGPYKTDRNTRLASTKNCERCMIISRLWELLLLLHPSLCGNRKFLNTKGHPMEMDWQMPGGIWEPQTAIPEHSSITDARPNQTICGRIRHIKMDNRGCAEATRHQQRLASLWIHITYLQCHPEKLQHLW